MTSASEKGRRLFPLDSIKTCSPLPNRRLYTHYSAIWTSERANELHVGAAQNVQLPAPRMFLRPSKASAEPALSGAVREERRQRWAWVWCACRRRTFLAEPAGQLGA